MIWGYDPLQKLIPSRVNWSCVLRMDSRMKHFNLLNTRTFSPSDEVVVWRICWHVLTPTDVPLS